MYPPPFEYAAPSSLEEAVNILNQRPDDSKVLAGGMSLIPLMKLRFASPEVIIDINRIPGLDYLQEGSDGALHMGALVRNRTIVRSDLIKSRYPLLASAAPMISDPIVRNRGTFVGSCIHADPQGDWGAVLLAMDGSIVAQGPSGRRTIPADQLIIGPFQTSLEPGEIAVEAIIPPAGERVFGSYMKLERKVGDFATAAVGVSLGFSGSSITKAGVALTGVGATNIKATAAEQVLVGSSLGQGNIQEAARAAANACDPKSDHRGSSEYKREIIRVFTARILSQAAGTRL